jgi:hypothetical protein
LAVGALKIIGVQISIYNTVYRLYTDDRGYIGSTSDLPTPWEYPLKPLWKLGIKHESEGIETTVIHVVPAAPSLDLVPNWENHHIQGCDSILSTLSDCDIIDDKCVNENSNHVNKSGRNNGDNGLSDSRGESGYIEGNKYIEKVVGLSLCPGEIKREILFALLQPLLTNAASACLRDDENICIKSEIEVDNDSDGENTDNIENSNHNNGNNCNTLNSNLVEDNIRITIHQWSTPPIPLMPIKTSKIPKIKYKKLIKTSVIQKDFQGFLKKIEKEKQYVVTSKSVAPIAPRIHCKLINILSGDKLTGEKSKGGNRSKVHLDPSLSLPLCLEFDHSPDVVLYRVDVESISQDTGNIKEYNEEEMKINLQSQLFLRR